MSGELKVTSRKADKAGVLAIQGELNADGEQPIRDAYQALTAQGQKIVVLDVAGTSAIDTTGIAILITLVMEARKKGHSVLISGVSLTYKRLFDLARFSMLTGVFESEASALASLN